MKLVQLALEAHPPEVRSQVQRALKAMRDVVKVDPETCVAYLEVSAMRGFDLPLQWMEFPYDDLVELTALVWTLTSRMYGTHSLHRPSLSH